MTILVSRLSVHLLKGVGAEVKVVVVITRVTVIKIIKKERKNLKKSLLKQQQNNV